MIAYQKTNDGLSVKYRKQMMAYQLVQKTNDGKQKTNDGLSVKYRKQNDGLSVKYRKQMMAYQLSTENK